ncbi:hypothetical protein pb186bvf_018099 [Paramecium bursaria]
MIPINGLKYQVIKILKNLGILELRYCQYLIFLDQQVRKLILRQKRVSFIQPLSL